MDIKRVQLAVDAKYAWRRCRERGCSIESDRKILREAYWDGCLPEDPDYSIAQWVEDEFPLFT